MANIRDYLLWRGDLSFDQDEFNEVDNVLLSQLVYLSFDKIIPDKGSIKLKDAYEMYRADSADMKESFFQRIISAEITELMAGTERFGGIELSDYRERIDKQAETQFCAMCIKINAGLYYIAYSGTDDTIAGWKENFNMSYLAATPGQISAAGYYEEMADSHEGDFILGGHSKGGNLAMYAAVGCSGDKRERILKIYNNDGPGFDGEVIKLPEYQTVLSRIVSIVPDSSLVGLLLEHGEEITVVQSEKNGVMQHDASSWKVEGKSFIRAERFTDSAIITDRTIKSWVAGLTAENRVRLVDGIFEILRAMEIETLEDISRLKGDKILEFIKRLGELDKNSHELVRSSIKSLIDQGGNNIRAAISGKLEQKNKKQILDEK